MDMRATYLGFGFFCATLYGWRELYGEGANPEFGTLCLLLAGVVSLIGGYRISVRRRRALLSAALEPQSGLRGVLTGRMGAILTAVVGTGATVPIVAYFALTASDPELYLAAAAAAWAIAISLLLDRIGAAHFRPQYRMSVTAPLAVGVAAIPVVAAAMSFSFWVLPLPDYAQAAQLPDAIAAALAGLPQHEPIVFEILSALRVADAFVYWLLAQNGFQAGLPLFLFLLKGAAIYLSVVKLAIDCQAALTRGEETP